MPITFACGCGKTLRVADEHAGKRVKCPACQQPAAVPAVPDDAGFEVVDDAPPPAPPPARPVVAKAVPVKPPAPPPPPPDDGFEVVEDDDAPAYKVKKGQTAKRIGEDDDGNTRPRPRRRQRDRHDDEDDSDRAARRRALADPSAMTPGRKSDFNKGMRYLIGGVLALLLGCFMLWHYWDSDEEVRGRFGRRRSMFGSAVAMTLAGVVFTAQGAFGLLRGDDDGDDDDE
jgi:hypothetical protein